jgi:ABC-type transport system involved in multi-copper enzyme maturation permease subunit
LMGLSILYSLLALLSRDSNSLWRFYNPLIRYGGFLLLCNWIIATGIRAASSVTRERDRDTLLSLLMLPVDRKEILWAKWYACWSQGKIFPYFLIGLLVIGVFFGRICGLYAPLSIGYCIVLVALSISLGLLVSVRSRTGFRATIFFFLIWIGIFIGPYFLAEMVPAITRSYESSPNTELAIYEFCRGLSPIQVWQTLNLPLYSVSYRGEEAIPHEVLAPCVWGAAASTLLAMLLAWILWKWACWQFEREDRR